MIAPGACQRAMPLVTLLMLMLMWPVSLVVHTDSTTSIPPFATGFDTPPCPSSD